ncbi:MAG: hypothetical protein LAT51_04155 [Flavobacteriaceae bacterium]|nr:hypothetical protein [Flavobacteriaceae bacterium]
MKKNILSLLFLSFMIISCSSDDDNHNGGNENESKNYLPSQIGNNWTYENKTTTNGNEQTANEDVSVESKNMEGDTEFFTLNSSLDNPLAPSVTSVLSGGELYKIDQSLFFNGDVDLGINDGFDDFQIDLSQVLIFDANANTNQILFTDSNSFSQEFNGINLTVEYGITSVNGEFFDSMEVNGVVYEDVISANLAISLEVTAGQSILTVAILEEQNVIEATHFFADGVGLIKSNVEINVEFEDLSSLPLPIEIPNIENINTLVEQELIDYNVEI